MKYLKKFENVDLENQIIKYLEDNYPEDWWDNEFSDRVYDYVSEDDYDEDEFDGHEDYYRNHAMGGAIEFDILDMINKDLMDKFEVSRDMASDLATEYMKNTITWYDNFVF